MKRFFLLAACLSLASMAQAGATNTNVVAFGAIRVAPENYKNKTVTYTETYQGFLTTIPNYMQASGYKEGKWFILQIGEPQLPVLLKKTDTSSGLLAMLKAGSKVRVSGRVREFRKEARSRFGMMPDYCVEAASVVLETGPDPMSGLMQQPMPGQRAIPPPHRRVGPPTL